jgi:hypothetical protein
MRFNKTDYFIDFENYIEWVIYIGTVIYVLPGRSEKANEQIVAGAISIFLAWINFSLFLKRFSLFGIYIIMTKRVFLTVCKVCLKNANLRFESNYFVCSYILKKYTYIIYTFG